MLKKVEKEIHGRNLTIETGELAKQASGAVVVRYGDTVILATVVVAPEVKEGADFFPMTVDYREKTYAVGKIPGGFFKREGRPREKEIITSRLIDRSLRPLFRSGFLNEIQVMVTVLSSDQENDSDVPGIIGSACAMCISPLPDVPCLAAVRIGRIGGQFVVNPTFSEMAESDLDLVVAGTGDSVIMIEGISKELGEDVVASAVEKANGVIREIIGIQEELIKQCPVRKMKIEYSSMESALEEEIMKEYPPRIRETLAICEKTEREEGMRRITNEVLEKFSERAGEFQLTGLLDNIQRDILRDSVLKDRKRTDARNMDEIRPITCNAGVLPRTHGSALFTRGQTQALVTATLGTSMDRQIMDDLEGEYKKRFMLHYNFPHFSTGEVRPERGPGRREIGHGVLAERALMAVLPREEEFPYTIRIVADILESNGSSSMASVCGGSLALMDAGVPVKSHVAGISIGMVKSGKEEIILTDIMGAEDHYGEMDFKVAGTRGGITAIQMDIKTPGAVTMNNIPAILDAARKGRLFILEKMETVISSPRKEVSSLAPKIIMMKVDTAKIREIIGPGGRVIKKIIEESGSKINVEDDGTVTIAGDTFASASAAKQKIEDLITDIEVGKVYKGKVARITNFGAFVELPNGKDGLVHISQFSDKTIKKVSDVVSEGDEILVKCVEIDSLGRINLSHKAALKEKQKK